MLSLFTNSGELQIFCCCVFSLPLSFPCPTFVTPVPAIVHIAHGGGSPPPQITREPQFGLSGKCKKAPRMRHKSGRQLPIQSWQQFMARNCGWLVGQPHPCVNIAWLPLRGTEGFPIFILILVWIFYQESQVSIEFGTFRTIGFGALTVCWQSTTLHDSLHCRIFFINKI